MSMLFCVYKIWQMFETSCNNDNNNNDHDNNNNNNNNNNDNNNNDNDNDDDNNNESGRHDVIVMIYRSVFAKTSPIFNP